MAYTICKKCQRFFGQNGKSYCNKCDNELNESREKINDYLETHPHASIIEIVKETGTKLKDVNIFLELGGAVSVTSVEKTVNLRQEEIKEQEEKKQKKESIKMKNNFTPRRLRG